MKEYNEIKLLRNISIIPIIVYILSSLIIVLIIFNLHEQQVKSEITKLKERNINRHKKLIKKEVYKIYNIIEFEYNKSKADDKLLNEKSTKKYILELIESIEYDKNGYIFIVNKNGDFLINVKKSFLTENYIDLNIKKGRETINRIINTAIKGERYIAYSTFCDTDQIEKEKISYVKNFEPWGWVIGYGFHPSDIQATIDERIERLKKENNEYLKNVMVITLLITAFLSIVLFLLSKKIKNIFTSYKEKIEKSEIKNRQKAEIIYHQSKMVVIGELLNMISHQWRQPLSQINSITLDLYLEQKKGTLNNEILRKSIIDIENTTEYLSQTIDDFSRFFVPETEQKTFLANNAIDQCIKIISPSIKHIDLKLDYKSSQKICGYLTLFQQVILTIISNSLDAFNSNNIKIPNIDIVTYDDKEFSVVEISDNAGGIPEKFIDKVFKLYFSTKKKDTASGLGLYIANKIITEQFQGLIYVQNFKDGVKFTIKVPSNGTK